MRFDEMRISSVALVIKVPQPKDKLCNFGNRKNHGFLFAEYGRLYYKCGREAYLSDSKHALYLPKGIDYTLHCVENSSTFVVNFDLIDDTGFDTPVSLRRFSTDQVAKTLLVMERNWMLQKSCYMPRVMSMLYEVIARISEANETQYVPQSRRNRIAPSIDYIERHFDDPNLTNDILAEKSAVSTVYFRKLFNEIYRMPPMRYVLNLRIEKACALLESGYISVSDTARAVGFNSVYHFSRTFRRSVGVTPSQYKQERRR